MTLRAISEIDLPLILVWRNSPEVRMSMYSKHEISEAEHRAWFARMQKSDNSFWYIYENEDGVRNGVVYFTDYQEKNHSAFWGFYTKPGAAPGTGTKLGLDAINEAFLEKKLHKLNAEVLSDNTKSIKFHKKLGFKEEGFFRDHYFNDGSYVDVLRFGMLSSEWVEKKAELESHIAHFRKIEKN